MRTLRTAVRRAAAGTLTGMCALAAVAAPAPPAAGRYGAELCVTTSAAAAPGCGPAEVELQASGSARVRISDLSYRLQLKSSQVEVVLMHGGTQIDEFTAPYEWVGNTLQFIDADKRARYELRLADRKPLK